MNPPAAHLSPPVSGTDDGLRVCLLASGSKGNSIYVSNGENAILIDAGLSGIEIERRMRARGLSPESLDALLVSHEHNDHIHGIGVLSRRFHLPVYLNPGTFQKAASRLGKLTAVSSFECGCAFQIGSLAIHPFSTSHDAADPAGFTIRHNTCKIGMATDLGIATAMVKDHLRQCNLLILEANHDLRLLENGPYPWPLKQRVKSRVGHLSNETARQLLMDVKHDGLSHVVLAHLSQQNNTPRHALREVGQALYQSRTKLVLADQTHGSDMFDLK